MENSIVVSISPIVVGVLAVLLVLLGLALYWSGKHSAAKSSQTVIRRKCEEIQNWMEGLTRVKPHKSLDHIILNPHDRAELEAIPGEYWDDARAAKIDSLVQTKLLQYEIALAQVRSLLVASPRSRRGV